MLFKLGYTRMNMIGSNMAKYGLRSATQTLSKTTFRSFMFGNNDEDSDIQAPKRIYKKYVPTKSLLFDHKTDNEGKLAKIFE